MQVLSYWVSGYGRTPTRKKTPSPEVFFANLSLIYGWQILARVYMARSDVGYTVRAAALHVWKTVVTNTPRTLAEVLPALMANIIASLAAPGDNEPPALQQDAVTCAA